MKKKRVEKMSILERHRKEYEKSGKELGERSIEAWDKYYKIREPAWEDYKLKKISQKEYDIIEGKAWEEYKAAREFAIKEYEAVIKRQKKEAKEAAEKKLEERKKIRRYDI